jgi:hypothetical protein
MTTPYEELVAEMERISTVIQKFPENLQGKVFDIMVKSYLGDQSYEAATMEEPEPEPVQHISVVDSNRVQPIKKRPIRRNKDSYSMVKDLDLLGKSGVEPFRDFLERYEVNSNIKFNTVAVYYLKNVLHIADVTIDHIYTCYKNGERKVPGNLRQSITDTSSSKYGYINMSDNHITLSVLGENLVEFELKQEA